MAEGAPDHSKLVLLTALDASGAQKTVLVDASGYLNAIMKAWDGSVLRNVKCDTSGQMISIIKGSLGENIAVDANGYLASIMKGLDDAVLRTIAVDNKGNMLAVMKGQAPGTLVTVAVDGNGQIIMVPRGQTGNYMAVDASGYLTTVMKGLEGATLRTIAVDTNGNIVGVMKGNYGGTLKTIETDSDGKLLMRIYDPLNMWGNLTTIGLAELANRIGAPRLIDNRGELWWSEDFEAGTIHWDTAGAGSGNTVVLDTDRAMNGEQSLKVVAGNQAGGYAGAWRRTSIFASDKLGLQVSFSPGVAYTLGTAEMYLVRYKGITSLEGALRWNGTNNKLQYLNTTGTWTDLATGFTIPGGTHEWHTMKIVCDFTTSKYIRALFMGTAYDMTNIYMYEFSSSADKLLGLELQVLGAAGGNATMYFDDLVLTVNE